jgi:hypothetical protein
VLHRSFANAEAFGKELSEPSLSSAMLMAFRSLMKSGMAAWAIRIGMIGVPRCFWKAREVPISAGMK